MNFLTENLVAYDVRVAHVLSSVTCAIVFRDIQLCYEEARRAGVLFSYESCGPGWMNYSPDMCRKRTCLTKFKHKTSLERLSGFDLIEVHVFGNPKNFLIRLDPISISRFFPFL